MRNYEAFRGMLRSAICNRTQAQFAVESGISAEHLSRMLNMDIIHRPTRTTLMKIASAAKNGITLQDMLDALNQDDNAADQSLANESQTSVSSVDFRKTAETTIKSLCRILKEQHYPMIVDSISEYISRMISSIDRFEDTPEKLLPIAYEIGQDFENFGHYCSQAERWAPVWLSMADRRDVAESALIIYFNEFHCSDNKIRYIIHEATCKVNALIDQYGFDPVDLERAGEMLDGKQPYPEGLSAPEVECENGEPDREILCMALASKLPYQLNFTPVRRFQEKYHSSGRTPEERLLEEIFGEKSRWSETIDGFGFWTDGIPSKLARFLSQHASHILAAYKEDDKEDEEYVKLKKILDMAGHMEDNAATAEALDKMDFQDPDLWDDKGWQSAVAIVMRAETGFLFQYHAPASDLNEFPDLSAQGCIMIDKASFDDIQRETLLFITCRYARALGISRFGDILFTGIHEEFRKPMTYVVKEPDETESNMANNSSTDENEIEYIAFDREHSRPELNGPHMVKLKDGRLMRLFWFKDPGIWIRAHKDWSNMVASFNPKLSRIPDTENKKE